MLTDIIPAKARKYVYALLALASLGVTCWQAADHDWLVAAGAFVVAISHSVAASNVKATPVVDATTLGDIVQEVRDLKGAIIGHVSFATASQTNVLVGKIAQTSSELADAVKAIVPQRPVVVPGKVSESDTTVPKPAAKKAPAKRAARKATPPKQ